MDYVHAFERTVSHLPDRVLVETLDGRQFTATEVDRRTDALAADLDARVGDARAAALLQNGPAAIETVVAAHKRGRANVQMSYRSTPKQVCYMLDVTDADALVVDDANAEVAATALEEAAIEAVYHVGDDPGPLHDAIAYEPTVTSAVDPYEVDNVEPAESGILFTSGTTGMPKAVPETQADVWLASSQAVMEMSYDPTDVGLMMAPWFHDVTLVTCLLPHLQVGARLVTQPAFDPEEALAAIEAHGVTTILAVPAQLQAMLRIQREAAYDLDTITDVRTGGAMVPPPLVERIQAVFDAGVHNTYGLTEGISNLTHAYPFEQETHPGTVGPASFTWEAIRVVEAADPPAKPDVDAEVGPGGTGELIGHGPAMTEGYLARPEATEALFIDAPDGTRWLRTGDVAQVGEDGGLWIVDRIDNMLVSGGENVYPQEVELVLGRHDGVLEVCVVGVPDEDWGHRVAAVVVPDGEVTEEALDAHCVASEDLEDFKRPRTYVFTDEELPRSDSGTINRPEVLAAYFDA